MMFGGVAAWWLSDCARVEPWRDVLAHMLLAEALFGWLP